jgi:hypothetical protein
VIDGETVAELWWYESLRVETILAQRKKERWQQNQEVKP